MRKMENARLLRRYMQALLGEHILQDLTNKWNDRRDCGKDPEQTMLAVSMIMMIIV